LGRSKCQDDRYRRKCGNIERTVHSLHVSVHVSLKSLSRTKAYFDPLDALPMPHEAVEGVLEGDRVEVKNGEELAERGFGVQAGESLWLSLVEAAYLVDKGELRVVEAESGVSEYVAQLQHA